MDPSSYALQAARQAQGFGYGPTYHFPNPGSVGIKLEATPASVPQISAPGPTDANIASADHDTLMRVGNSAYIHIWHKAQSMQASLDAQNTLLSHYGTLLSGHASAQPGIVPGLGAAVLPPAGVPQAYGHAGASFYMAPAAASAASTTWPFPIFNLPTPLSHDDYPDAKWWYQHSWKGENNAKTNRGQTKSDSSSSGSSSGKRSTDGNKKLIFLTDIKGEYIGKTLLDRMGKTFFDLLTDLQSALGPRMPQTYSVAGATFKNHLRYHMAIQNPDYIAFRLCDNLWKFEQYCIIKWSEWARNNLCDDVKEEKRKRKQVDVIEVSDGEGDEPVPKKIKTEPRPSSSKTDKTADSAPKPSGTVPNPTQVAPKATVSAKTEGKKASGKAPVIPPVESSIVVPLEEPSPIPDPSNAKSATAGKGKSTKGPKPTKAELAASKIAKPTNQKTSKNLYLIDYIKTHGEVTVGAFDAIFGKLEIKTKLEYERKSIALQEEAKAKANEKRAATKAAKAALKTTKAKTSKAKAAKVQEAVPTESQEAEPNAEEPDEEEEEEGEEEGEHEE